MGFKLLNENVVETYEKDFIEFDMPLLDILLKDRSTGQNIIWATSDYCKLGKAYRANREIESTLITGTKANLITPRITKTLKRQNNRTREKAEVFTPSWVCNEQNNIIDDQWFGKKNIFNIQRGKIWEPNAEKIVFPNVGKKTWKDYIDARRIEITCGEAPYLVSRYDTATGNMIDLQSRIGLLDRKLRVVNENVDDIKEWMKWTERAFQSVYGYEYQGDNLLLARENLLKTFIDNMEYKYNRNPKTVELKRIATIISWNLWQMDGTTGTVPYDDLRVSMRQLTIFDYMGGIENKVGTMYCNIKDWRSKAIIRYTSLLKGGF